MKQYLELELININQNSTLKPKLKLVAQDVMNLTTKLDNREI